MFTLDEKIDILNKYINHKYDTGSIKIQIILITFKINNIKKHLSFNNKDYSARRGMVFLVNRRKKLLFYLKKNDLKTFNNLLKDLFLDN